MNCYHCVKDIPEAFQAPILLLVELGIPTGYGNAGSNPKNLVVDLSHDMLRTLVCNYRAVAYDRALLAVEKAPLPLPWKRDMQSQRSTFRSGLEKPKKTPGNGLS